MNNGAKKRCANKSTLDERKQQSKKRKRGRDAQIAHDTFDFGHFLQIRRKECNLTQKEAAIRMQMMGYPITESVICEIEGGRMDASIVQLAMFSFVYGFDYAELFGNFYKMFLVYVEKGDLERKTH